MCNLFSSSMPSFPEVNMQNLGRQKIFFILKKFLDLSQYNPDAVSNAIELTAVGFPEPHPTIYLTCQWHSFPCENRHCQCSQCRKDLCIQGSHQSHLTSAGINMDLCGHRTVLRMSQSPVLKENMVLCLLFPPCIQERAHLG